MSINDKRTKIVIAIDFGTSRSGYAYAFRNDNKIIGRTEWKGQGVPYIKTVTRSLYGKKLKLISWGYEAQSEFSALRSQQSVHDYTFFTSFKMALRESRERDENGPIITESGRKFAVINLIADYLRELKNLVFEDLNQVTGDKFQPNEVLWCLTIPAIWKDDEKSFMRRAAEKAGLISSDVEDRDRLLLVLEPEAAAIYCQEKDRAQLKDEAQLTRDKCFMVVDCGGGTVDITVHKVSKNGGLEEVAPGTGGSYGSTYVDREFVEFLARKLTTEAVNRFREKDPIKYLELLNDWERKKCDFDPDKPNTTNISIPRCLDRILEESHPEVLETLANEQRGDNENIYITRVEMMSFFTPVLDGLVSKVKEQLAKIKGQTCDMIYLVGGFSTSPVLRQRIQAEFGEQVKIIMPSTPGAAIVEGAVSFGLNPTSIRSRKSRRTYGYGCCEEFDIELEATQCSQRKVKFFEDKNKWYVYNRFSPFVSSGESINVDSKVTRSLSVMRKDQSAMGITFYASNLYNPHYIDEDGMEKLGQVTVDISSTLGTLDASVEISFSFGNTEILVEAINTKTNQKYNTTLEFLSTYSIE